jgi:uncharacterized hydrophobic protein (TIGR00271 family)
MSVQNDEERPPSTLQQTENDTSTAESGSDGVKGRDDYDDDNENAFNTIDHMKHAVFFLYPDRKQRLSRFWLLIILASIISTSGLAGESVATVIGAMIVAPLMRPILGTILSIVLGDGPNFRISFLLVFLGAGAAILIGYLIGLCTHEDTIRASNNSQVAARTTPKLPDLLAALATGAVAAVALVRRDIGDTLPGVAISISLVPPLNVVGLALSTRNIQHALGAFLLFATNMASILFMGVIAMFVYRVHDELDEKKRVGFARRSAGAFFFLLALLGAISFPLALTSNRFSGMQKVEECLQEQFKTWAEPHGWNVSRVTASGQKDDYEASVILTGPPPIPDQGNLTDVSASNACNVKHLEISFIPKVSIDF